MAGVGPIGLNEVLLYGFKISVKKSKIVFDIGTKAFLSGYTLNLQLEEMLRSFLQEMHIHMLYIPVLATKEFEAAL